MQLRSVPRPQQHVRSNHPIGTLLGQTLPVVARGRPACQVHELQSGRSTCILATHARSDHWNLDTGWRVPVRRAGYSASEIFFPYLSLENERERSAR